MKLLKLLGIAFCVLSLCAVSCAPEDGADGTNGMDGANGQNGANGTNGKNGEDGANGAGYEELAKYGHVTMVLEGTRTDGEAFKDSTGFKYTSVDLSIEGFNEFLTDDDQIDYHYSFQFIRFLSAPDDVYQDSSIAFTLPIFDLGGEDQTIGDIGMSLFSYAVVGDNQFFTINDSFIPSLQVGVTMEVTDLVFDLDTNHLTFSYRVEDITENNTTGHPLTITGNADVILLERIQ